MPPTTALRPMSTVMVGVLLALAFVCSGPARSLDDATQGTSAIGVQAVNAKSAARTLEHVSALVNQQLPDHLQILSSGPEGLRDSPQFVDHGVDARPLIFASNEDVSTTDRAPPAR